MSERVDAHHRFTPDHPGEHFGPILKRNRFAGSVCIVEQDETAAADFDFVLAVIARSGAGSWRGHPKFRGVLWETVHGPADELRPGETLDLSIPAPDLAAAAQLAERLPNLRIAIDHMGGPDIAHGDAADWAHGIEALARYPHVYCKLSGLVRLAPAPWKAADLRPYVHRVLRSFGPQRTMFGSGWPDCLPEYGWKETLAAFTQALGAAPMDLREQLLGGTAARFYALDKPAL